MSNPFSLENKTILVTGASSGIGKSIAIECSKMGAKLIITGRNESRLHETSLQLQGDGHISIVADLSTEDGVDFLVSNLPILDGCVNNAGFVKTLPVQFINKTSLDDLLMVNTIAPILILQKLTKTKKIRKGSSVVFISSICGLLTASLGNSIYSTTKAAICGFAKNAALDLSSKGIRVNTVCPATVETPIMDEGVITQEQLELDKNKYPLKRYGRPEEVAYAVIYLLSDASAWTTGSHLTLDGGITLV